MLSKIPQKYYEQLTVRELEELLERKRTNPNLAQLIRERDRLRLELHKLEEQIELIDRSQASGSSGSGLGSGSGSGLGSGSSGLSPAGMAANDRSAALGASGAGSYGFSEPEAGGAGQGRAPSFLAGKRKRNLKDYIAQVLLDAGTPLSPSDIQARLPEAGYLSNSTNPRSFYNTVFQALQRYDIFEKENKKYRLSGEALRDNGVKEILPKKKTRLKDFIVEVLDKSETPLKASEISSRVVIAGYDTDLEMDELNQRVSATLKKYLNKDFDWDSQRYRLAARRA